MYVTSHAQGEATWSTIKQCFYSLKMYTQWLQKEFKPLKKYQQNIKSTLGMFYAPCRPLSNTVILEYRDPISRYARRFFHHLLRHQRFEKAFLLAVDIGARDLFMVSILVMGACREL
uniref:Uncharacterized protein n=1 Tax=Sinocyclocheilus grahami TaxID=75366 RepID=A0A672KI90_SINGR